MDARNIGEKIKEVSQKIAKEFKPEKIILFGSRAWGEPSPDSDVDLLVIKKAADNRKLAREIDSSIFPRPFPLDLIVYGPEQVEQRKLRGDFFINDILTKGKILYAQ
ncbi:MAG: nucleotidyltransferase domain-containing protein [Patescibacteria group bacterium]